MKDLSKSRKYNSLYLVEQINLFRKEEGSRAVLRHSDLITKIESEFDEEIGERNISLTYYKDKSNRKSKCYDLEYEQALQMLMAESKIVRKAVIKRIKALQEQLKDPLRNTKVLTKRFERNKHKIPKGYFCMIKEVINLVVMPLEVEGKDLVKKCMPDSSLGRGFCEYLRDKAGIDTGKLKTYRHELDNGYVVDAKLYPFTEYHLFDEYMTIWLSNNGEKYFTDKSQSLLG